MWQTSRCTGPASVSLGTNLSYAGSLTESAGTIALASQTLTLTGTSTLAGAVTAREPCRLRAGIPRSAAACAIARLTVSGGTMSLGGDLTYLGRFARDGRQRGGT